MHFNIPLHYHTITCSVISNEKMAGARPNISIEVAAYDKDIFARSNIVGIKKPTLGTDDG